MIDAGLQIIDYTYFLLELQHFGEIVHNMVLQIQRTSINSTFTVSAKSTSDGLPINDLV